MWGLHLERVELERQVGCEAGERGARRCCPETGGGVALGRGGHAASLGTRHRWPLAARASRSLRPAGGPPWAAPRRAAEVARSARRRRRPPVAPAPHGCARSGRSCCAARCRPGGARGCRSTPWGRCRAARAGPLSRRELLGIFPKVYSGTHVHHPACTVLRSTSVLIEHSHVGPVPPAAFADGERIGPLPLRVEVRPGAVRLLAW